MNHANFGFVSFCAKLVFFHYYTKKCSIFEGRPEEFKDRKYDEVFDQARTQKLTEKDLMDYLNSKISEARMLRCEEAGYIRGVREGTAKGREEGREEERLVIAKSMLSTGAEVGYVVTVTGLSEEQVKSLK